MRNSGPMRAGVVACVAVVAMVVAGCGSSGVTGKSVNPASVKNPNARHVDRQTMAAAPNADVAANEFSNYYIDADATECNRTDIALDGHLSNLLWAEYSCTKVMTPQEVQWHCTSDGGVGNAAHAHVATISRHPLTLRYTHMVWGADRQCPGHGKHTTGGNYDVTVQKTKAGWIAIGFKTVSGPGAGISYGPA